MKRDNKERRERVSIQDGIINTTTLLTFLYCRPMMGILEGSVD